MEFYILAELSVAPEVSLLYLRPSDYAPLIPRYAQSGAVQGELSGRTSHWKRPFFPSSLVLAPVLTTVVPSMIYANFQTRQFP